MFLKEIFNVYSESRAKKVNFWETQSFVRSSKWQAWDYFKNG
jgi:hypothetical protein